jgi:antirestriction protein ArdC
MKTDIYQQVAATLIASIEAGLARGDKWSTPWRKTGQAIHRPVNGVTNHTYRGINVLLLWAAADKEGYTAGAWASLKQWNTRGGRVRQGEKGTVIVFYKLLEVQSKTDPNKTDSIPMLRMSHVFNVAQVEGIEAPAPADPVARHGHVDDMIRALGAQVIHGSDEAFYRPSTDEIVMPSAEQFTGGADKQREGYYSVLLHELVHWTGHKSRLDRLNNYVGKGRAFEELIAELGSAFLCAELGISNEPREDHGHYLASWLSVLKDEPRAFFRATSAAEKACDFIRSAVLAEDLPIAA